MASHKPRDIFKVFLDDTVSGGMQQVGTLYRQTTRTDLPASFAYEPAWLESGNAFMLDPRLELWTDEQYPPARAAAFGIFMDSAPDRWGRVLMERREAAAADRENRPMRQLQEIDFLLGVHDQTRVGALRFQNAAGEFLDNSPNAAPPVTDLATLAYVSLRIEEDNVENLPEYAQWLAMLIAPGTSLGGARPKANFTSLGNELWIAKFPAKDDRYDIGAWEYVVHRLAAKAGIWVPASELKYVGTRYGTFCVERFDRGDNRRRMYASAMTLLERQDGDPDASYLDIAEYLASNGAQGHIDSDLAQLFKRVVFNVVVGNRDDHLRNHGFIHEASGWRLSPAFDMNPNPARREHALTFDGASALPDLDAVVETADFYRLDAKETQRIVDEVRDAVTTWRDEAAALNLSRPEIQRMENVFQV
ncbi:type II toxin-antitoxin system HipA family toxin [Paraburkholderia sp. D15]|uniref:type II toxin-antitoxin system HipA family toxin n=1 Tax=Paraburkholderia sp. D15 TaxID=2880218 RepID=UPI0024787498|nr:type II toxin-antitoxin system HipA family toxin [Paraburkholderia sp. D15]WGS53824.1 type II toxin-antitoxin system HipA family toxin [Paraburkholderia sp. D15]